MRSLLLLCGFIFILGGPLMASPPNPYEVEIIQEEVTKSFNELMQVWKEELYFEMYEMGQRRSKLMLRKPDFAQRMVELKWKPELSGQKIDHITVDYRNFVELTVVIPFNHKVNIERKLQKRFVFHLVFEENHWRYDLKTFIRAPFSGHYLSETQFNIPHTKKGKPPVVPPKEPMPNPAAAPAEPAP